MTTSGAVPEGAAPPIPSVVVLGDILIDELRDGDRSREMSGGSALNVAGGLVTLGVAVTLSGPLSSDSGAHMLAADIASAGIALAAWPADESPRAVSVRSDGEPTYAFNAAARARRLVVTGDLRRAVAGADVVAVSGFAFDDAEQVEQLRSISTGRTLAIDPNPRTGLLADAEAFRRGLLTAAPGAALVKLGVDDIDLVFGVDPGTAVRQLRDAGARRVLLTRGAEGARLVTPHGDVGRAISDGEGPVVDTMGAGDATFAVFVGALATDPAPDWAAVLQRAMDVAAATVRAEGGALRLHE